MTNLVFLPSLTPWIVLCYWSQPCPCACSLTLISLHVVFMYKQHIPIRETRNRICALLYSWKVRRR